MRRKISESIQIPEGVTCDFNNSVLKCTKGSVSLERKINIPEMKVKIENNNLTLEVEKGNKTHLKKIRTYIAHITNIFHGLDDKFTYTLEAVNVHFPMTLKVEGSIVTITNFLGEKRPRKVKILPNVEVEVKGQSITVSSHDKEAAGQTAANLEKAGKLKGKDRRIFQDGIYITQKPKRWEVEHHA
jgi:large subunit ribosomal protein L6